MSEMKNARGQIDTVRDRAGTLLAVVIYGWTPEPGVRFFTEPDMPLQVGCMRHPPGKVILPHVHDREPRTTCGVAEVLFLRRGRLRADFFGADLGDLSSRHLVAGDAVILLSGGHGFEVEGVPGGEGAELWEVRNGPYLGPEVDKTRVTLQVPVLANDGSIPSSDCPVAATEEGGGT